MKPNDIKWLIVILAVGTALLDMTTLVTSGLCFPSRLPLLSRALLGGGATVFPITTYALWRRAAMHSGNCPR
jgi:hypothetical protein